ncbi:MAG: ubiquitin-like protein Pup [Acidimicrobiia bacterium]|jgi:ubiquitin-like protein Pup|nr:ubiquitin-like protein Pup [Acidimicrobiia bacterium]
MAEQEKKRQTKPAETEAEVDEDVVVDAQPAETTEKIDDLLDEIDSVLEENAEEFVKNYVQKGGE